jgi:dTDP-4-dehydrorhamnose reductase
LIVVGAAGQLGAAFRRYLGSDARYLTRSDADLGVDGEIGRAIKHLRPKLVINCAGYNDVDAAESDEATAVRVNALAVQEIALAAAEIGAKLVTFSSDFVFDGTKREPYTELDSPAPLNVYGRSKHEGEVLALAADVSALVIRTSWLMSGTHPSFVSAILDQLAAGTVKVVDDQTGSPTFVDDVVSGTLEAVNAGASGILHISNTGETSRFDLAQTIASAAGEDPDRVVAHSSADLDSPASRPAYSALDSVRRDEFGLSNLPGYRDATGRAVEQFLRARR